MMMGGRQGNLEAVVVVVAAVAAGEASWMGFALRLLALLCVTPVSVGVETRLRGDETDRLGRSRAKCLFLEGREEASWVSWRG